MASEFIQSVLQTEEECRKKEAQARQDAELKKQETKKKAQEIVEQARQQVEQMLEDDAKATSKSAEMRLEKEKAKVRGQCEELSRTAEKNMGKVRKMAVELLTK